MDAADEWCVLGMEQTLFCETDVSQHMGTDIDADGDRIEKIDVRVFTALLERIEEAYQRRGYSSRSAAIRDALRDWVEPSVELSDAVLDELTASREQRAAPALRTLTRCATGLDSNDDSRYSQLDYRSLVPPNEAFRRFRRFVGCHDDHGRRRRIRTAY